MIHLITLTHKHGEDVIVLAEAPTSEQIKEIETWYSKVHDLDVAAHYYSEVNLDTVQEPSVYIRTLKSTYEYYNKGDAA